MLDEYRKNVELPELQEDPIEIIKSMRSSSPPPSSTDMMNAQKRGTRQKRVSKILCIKYYQLNYFLIRC